MPTTPGERFALFLVGVVIILIGAIAMAVTEINDPTPSPGNPTSRYSECAHLSTYADRNACEQLHNLTK